MNKIGGIVCISCLLTFCGPRQTEVDKVVEDGVEVVLNHPEPYPVNDEPTLLSLEETLKIDLEQPEFAEFGFREPDYVDADS